MYGYVGKHRPNFRHLASHFVDRTPIGYVGKHRPYRTLWELIQAAQREGRSLL